MLTGSSPDVVHVTTPPQSHYSLARQCLEAGTHVYLEKPFTVTAGEAESLIDLAERKGLRVTAGHNYQFTQRNARDAPPCTGGVSWRSARPPGVVLVVRPGRLCLTSDPCSQIPTHWVRRLPGQLFHNVISHGIARLAEWLLDDVPDLVAWASQSAYLARVLSRRTDGRTACDDQGQSGHDGRLLFLYAGETRRQPVSPSRSHQLAHG